MKRATVMLVGSLVCTPMVGSPSARGEAEQDQMSWKTGEYENIAGMMSREPGAGETSSPGTAQAQNRRGKLPPVWSTIAGGGVTFCTGGDMVLGGTIGQAAAGVTMTSSTHSITDGFWVAAPSAPTCRCGDFDDDDIVNLQDFALFAACFGQSPPAPGCGCMDMNGDDAVNLQDFAVFASLFGSPWNGQSPPNCD